ncbi:MAG: hypothetical protein IKA46_03305 [Clostridia bacterium]|nr:hypothetical protein [Clostridia bacterium]
MELILLAFCAFLLISNIFLAFTRGLRKSLLRLGTVVLAVVAAYFLSRAIAASIGSEIALWLKVTFGGNPNFAPMFSGEAGADKAVGTLAQMLVAPLLFLLLYWVLKAVLLLLYWLLSAVTRPATVDSASSRFIALPIGILIAFIGIFAFVSPVMGYLDVASATIAEVDAGESTEMVEELSAYNTDLVFPALQTPVVSSLYGTLGEKLFEGLTVGEWDGEKLHLKTELTTLGKVAGGVQLLGATPAEQYGEAECAAVDALAQNISNSHMLSVLCAGVLNTASNHWLSGESFLGILPPDLGANGNVLLNAFLEVFATSSRENLGEDLDFFADVFVLAVRYEVLADLGNADENALAELITDSGFLADTQALLQTHPRMAPVGKALVDVGMRCALNAMGLPEDLEQSCGEILTDMTTVLKETPVKADGSIDDEALASSLTAVFAAHDISIGEAAVSLVAQGIADHFTPEELQDLSLEDAVDKLIERFGSVDISGLTVNDFTE